MMNERPISIFDAQFPLFVLLPDEGCFIVHESIDTIAWHEQIDLDDETHWVWDRTGQRFCFHHTPDQGFLLEKSLTDELDLFLVIARWNLYWAQQKGGAGRHHGNYKVLKAQVRKLGRIRPTEI